MRSLSVILTGWVIVGMAWGGGAAPSLLIKFRADAAHRIESLSIPVAATFAGNGFALADLSALDRLTSGGIPYQILDRRPLEPGEYYLVWSPRGQKFERLRLFGEKLFEEGNRAIIKTTRSRAWRIPALGFEISKLTAEPAGPSGRLGSLPSFDSGGDTILIREMVNQVSEDSVRALIQRLEDFGTRYSPAPGCSAAAEYIKNRFSKPGLNSSFHDFSVVLTPTVCDIAALSGSEAWVVDDNGRIGHTTDRGTTWQESYRQPDDIPLLGVEFETPLLGYACGREGLILKTADGGATWTEQSRGASSRYWDLEFVSPTQGWAAGDSGRVGHTTNGGAAWTVQQVGQPATLYGISFVNATVGWVVGYVSNGSFSGMIFKTANGGLNWTVQKQDSTVIFYGVEFVDASHGWAAGMDINNYAARIYRTTDGGTTWQQQTVPGYGLLDIDFAGPTTGWACGYGNIVHTTNGAAWQSQGPSGFEVYRSTDFINADSGWVAGSSGLALSTGNGGSTWVTNIVGADTVHWRNVVATIPGKVHPESSVIICGHYDCTSENPSVNAPGADDNASGTAAVLAAASILSNYRFEKTVTCIAFSGEEQGLLGSIAYANEVKDTTVIGAVLNFDMVGYCDDARLDLNVIANSRSNPLAALLADTLSPRYTTLESYRVFDPSMTGSDHAPFWNIGVPAICAIERDATEWNPFYHTSGDAVATLNMPFATEAVKLGVAALAYLARPIGRAGAVAEPPAASRMPVRLSCEPNPFTPKSGLRLLISGNGPVDGAVFDAAGGCVKTFPTVRVRIAGTFTLTWDGRGDDGHPLPEGVYFIRFDSENRTTVKKIVLIQ